MSSSLIFPAFRVILLPQHITSLRGAFNVLVNHQSQRRSQRIWWRFFTCDLLDRSGYSQSDPQSFVDASNQGSISAATGDGRRPISVPAGDRSQGPEAGYLLHSWV